MTPLARECARALEHIEFYGTDMEGLVLPVNKFFRKGKSMFAVCDWSRGVNTSVSVLFKGLYGDYWFEYAERSVLLGMQELTDEQMYKINPALVEETRMLTYNESAMKYLLDWMSGICASEVE